jgi:CRP-like cAMP-binding protein
VHAVDINSSEAGRVLHKHTSSQHCVGCPALGRNVLEGLLGEGSAACGFDSLAVEARSDLPASWLGRYGFAIVRRGYLIRQRTDAAGRTTAIDAVGPGCCFPLDSSSAAESSVSGYAVTRALVCLCDDATIERGLNEGGPTAVQVHQLDSEAISRMERLADARGRSGAAAKVAALLCTLSDTLRPGDEQTTIIPAEFLQRDLAALLSIRHESVCRVMRDFGKQGLVEKTPEGVALVDRAGLETM